MACFLPKGLLLGICLALSCLLPSVAQNLAEPEQKMLGQAAPLFQVITLEGDTVNLADLRENTVVVINFWFPSCAPCLMEFPHLNDVREQYKDDEVIFLAISVQGSEERIKRLLTYKPFHYEIVVSDFSIAQTYGVKLYPSNLVIDRQGMISFFKTGYREDIDVQLSQAIQEALGKNKK